MFFVWFYAALLVARKVSMLGLLQTSLLLPADIPACAPQRLVLLPLRHVHQVYQANCFVTRLAPQLESCNGYQAWLLQGAFRQPPATPGARWHREAGLVPWHAGRGGSKNVAKCFENLPAFLRKDFQNLLPRFARGGRTIVSYLNNFPPPLDPHLSADSG